MKSIPILTKKNIWEIEKRLEKLAQAKYRKTGLPFVILKYAQTLDGKIATLSGDSKWISARSSLCFAHRLRNLSDAILVGVNTILRDDPQLTVRLIKGKNPQRIIVDGQLRISLDCKVLKGKGASSTIIATTSLSERAKVKRIQTRGAKVWLIKKDRAKQICLQDLLEKLGENNIRLLLVEGGSKIITSFLKKRLADHLIVIIAPKIIGEGVTCVNSSTQRRFKNLIFLSSYRVFKSDDDVIVEASLKWC